MGVFFQFNESSEDHTEGNEFDCFDFFKGSWNGLKGKVT